MAVKVYPGLKIDTGTDDNTPHNHWGTLSFLASPIGRAHAEGPKYLVANAHVLADPILSPEKDDAVYAYDGASFEKIATLVDWASLTETRPLGADVAVAKLVPGIDFDENIPEIGPITGVSNHTGTGLKIYTYGAASRGFKPSKITSGRSSSATTFAYVERDPAEPTGTYRVADLVSCEDYGNPGDSGSPILNRRGRIIGIHVGEWTDDQTGTTSLFSPISEVLRVASALAEEKLKVWHRPARDFDLRDRSTS